MCCMASMFFVAGQALDRKRRELGLDSAREVLQGHALQARAGVTAANPQVLILRVLAPQVEPAMNLLKQVWAVWRQALWDMPATQPRIWRM